MVLDVPFLIAVISLIVGILILLIPRLLNYIVAIYLIVIGILGILNAFTWWEDTPMQEAQQTLGTRRVAATTCLALHWKEMTLPMLLQHTTKHHWITLAIVALFALLPILGIGQQQSVEAAQVKEQSARASWTKCTGTTCTDTVIIGTSKGNNKTLSFEETTYRKNTNKVISRREAFANIGNKFTQNGLQSASVNARIAVKKCDSRDVCKSAGSVQVNARWTGKGKTRTDPEDGTRFRSATVTGTVAGKALGQVNFATLSVRP
jgi:hypothetical protein